uniref:ABC1 atypical kinase-like domain-containing protein n=1 Tax=Alexandrium monilatum TaxID=311494 RepID=A0A7S4Q2V1_9DINO
MGPGKLGAPGVECFAFLWGRVALAAAARAPKGQPDREADDASPEQCREGKPSCTPDPRRKLEDLEEACRRAASRRGRLALRVAAVTARLLPIGCCCALDLLRPGGPKRGVKHARKLRVALEALGPAFVKLGQALAAREDVLSEPVAKELRKLCDQVPAFPCGDARRLLAEELGALAPALEGTPVASASLGQVYRITWGQREYAMKVQRPGLAKALAVDLVVLRGLAFVTRRIMGWICATSMDPVQVVRAWSRTLWQELDYTREADFMERMHGALSRVDGLVIPRVCKQLTSVRVLTTEWVHGVSVSKEPRSIQDKHIRVGVETYAAMILDLGMVHADPHAGNMLVTQGNDLCLLDFGMVIEIPPKHRTAWAECLVNLVRRDHDATLDSLITIGFFPADCPRAKIMPVMKKIWTELVSCGSNTKKRKNAVKQCYQEICTLALEFEFSLPDYYLALVRALLTLEGLALTADCDFDIFKVAFPVALRLLTASAARDAQARATSALKASAEQLCSRRGAAAAVAASLVVLGAVAATVAGVQAVGA